MAETSHLHPDFCPLQSAPAIGGMLPDAKFGDALGAPPLADHLAPHDSDHDSELPNDPIGDFARATTPPSSQPENMNGRNQWNVTVVMFIDVSCQLHRLVGALEAGKASAMPAEFNYSSRFKTFCHFKIRKILTTSNVDSYTTNSTLEGMLISRTPLVLLQPHIDSQDPQWMRNYLPPGYPDLTTAQVSLLGQMRLLLKYNQGLLLTNIKELNCRPITGPVPTMDDLIVLIDHGVGSPTLRSVPSIRLAYGGTGRVRIAYLRLSIAEQIFHPDRLSSLTTWEIIDRRLQYVKTQSQGFQFAYSQVVLEKDVTAFDGAHQIEQIDQALLHLPTNAEVVAYMDQSPDAPQGASLVSKPFSNVPFSSWHRSTKQNSQ
ncbi:hypothetical protein PCASD_05545 [Puccinia coronata f. sp. avenae]|uniref:Uncharacterized protein n=1 Tax=Puccinia coronata f. sp. avenae TaxID=200324 RepID=A0A2N5UVS1_9BASI|nr:hypothetical protein PCASD_05545 [Puccinia coronata f. sp. avenae]